MLRIGVVSGLVLVFGLYEGGVVKGCGDWGSLYDYIVRGVCNYNFHQSI